MNWTAIEKNTDLTALAQYSHTDKVLIFKHSTRCAISTMALNRLERAWQGAEMTTLRPYYLDLIRYRELSNQIAQDFGIQHESPQVIVIADGKVIYHASHYDIQYEDLKALL
jgi:bacillithiol system protein YtxJ